MEGGRERGMEGGREGEMDIKIMKMRRLRLQRNLIY